MNQVRVRYFASIREMLGPGEEVELPEGATVSLLRDWLIQRSERHAAALARGKAIRCALNQALCDESAVPQSGAEVAFFPPVTGG